MIKIQKEWTFEAGHCLPGHDGKCSRPHGHSYRVRVWVKGIPITDLYSPKRNMVMDYADLDAIVKPIVDSLDHRTMFEGGRELLYLSAVLTRERHPDWYVYIGMRTTAENLCIWFWNQIRPSLPDNIDLMGVVICETAKTTAEFIRPTRSEPGRELAITD